MVILFFILTVINLPVYAFFYAGNEAKNAKQGFQWEQRFAQLTLGNIGQSDVSCGSSNVAIQNNLTMSCSFGKLGPMSMFGFSKDDKSSCIQIIKSESENVEDIYLDGKCHYDKQLYKDETTKTNLANYYKANCEGKIDCSIPNSIFNINLS